jgi:hypothetical protein
MVLSNGGAGHPQVVDSLRSKPMLRHGRRLFPFIERIFADGGYHNATGLANRLARPRDPLSGRGDLQHPLGSRNALGEICERLLQSRSMMRPSK